MKRMLLTALLSILAAPLLQSGLSAASAIAYSKEAYGYSFNVTTVEEAERLAIEMCKKNGGIDVKILISTKDHGYGAIAADGNVVGGVVGYPNLQGATQRSITECVRRGCKAPRIIATWYDRGY